jgi:hypothetical protein
VRYVVEGSVRTRLGGRSLRVRRSGISCRARQQHARCERRLRVRWNCASIFVLTLQRKPSLTSDSPCNWSQTNHVHSVGVAQEEIGCGRMGGLAGPHINTTLVILIGALYANARLLKEVPTPTKRQARERAARSASRGMSAGGFARGRTSSRLHPRRSIPRRASSRLRQSVLCCTQ